MLNPDEAKRLLTEEQLFTLSRIELGILKIKEAAERVNALMVESGLYIRPIPDYPLGMSMNDVKQHVFLHGLAEDKISKAARETVERLAA